MNVPLNWSSILRAKNIIARNAIFVIVVNVTLKYIAAFLLLIDLSRSFRLVC